MKTLAIVWGERRNHKPFETHHGFWERAAAARPDIRAQRFTWDEIGKISPGFDLYFFVDWNPILFRLPETLRPRALYWWDVFHYSFAYPAQVSEVFDRAFYAEKLTAEMLIAQGFDRAEWLPSGFDPGLYRPLPVRKVHDYAFIGQQDNVVVRAGLTRAAFLGRLGGAPGLHGYVGCGVHGETVNQVYNESKVLFDWTIFNNLGTRFFETIGSGGFLLMNRAKADNGMGKMGVDGTHYASYDGSFADFEAKLRYYLENDELRDRIARAGHEHFLANHTYAHRLDEILGRFDFPRRPA